MSPAELPKQIIVSITTLILFCLWAVLALKQKVTVLKWSRGLSLLLFLVASTTLSYFFSKSQYISFWGDRNLPADSLQTILVFFTLSFVFLQVVEQPIDFKRFSNVILITLAGQIAVGVIQRYGLYDHWYSIGTVFGTMGSKVALANVICACFPFLLNQIFRVSGFLKLFFLYALLTITGVTMLYSSSRTPLFVCVLAFTLVSAYELYTSFDRRKVGKIALVLLSAILAFSFFNYDMPEPELNRKIQTRLISKAFESRALTWKSALLTWGEHPLIGAGPEAFIITQRKYEPPEANNYEYWDTDWPKAHNQLFQALACTGLIGLLAQLSLFAYLSYYAVKSVLKKQTDERTQWLRTFYMMFFSIFLSNMTSFNFITTQLYSFVALVLFSAADWPRVQTWTLNIKPRLRLLIAMLVLIPALKLAYSSYQYSQADIYLERGVQKFNMDANPSQALNDYFQALTYDAENPLLYCQVSYAVGQMLINNHFVEKSYEASNKTYVDEIKVLSAQEKEISYKQMTEYLDLCISKADGKYHYFKIKAELYNRLYANGLASRLETEASYQDMVKQFPNNPENYYKLGLLALHDADNGTSVSYLNQALDLKSDYLVAYGELLNYYYDKRDFEKIVPLVGRIEKIRFNNPQFVPYLLQLADLARKNGDLISVNIFLRLYAENKFLMVD